MRALITKRAPGAVELTLYVADRTDRSVAAISNLEILKPSLGPECHIRIVDVAKHPRIAREDQIVTIPTLVRRSPLPVKILVGDLSNTARVLASLGIATQSPLAA